jgi:DNA-binding MarR family transcriptional regulator
MRSFLHGPCSGHDDLEAGRRIRRYTITDAGRVALAQARHALRERADELPSGMVARGRCRG